jgi:hypothetical protein
MRFWKKKSSWPVLWEIPIAVTLGCCWTNMLINVKVRCPSARHGGGREEIQRQQVRVSGQLHARAALPPGKNFRTHKIGRWVGPRVDLGCFRENKILCPCLNSKPGPSGPWVVALPTLLGSAVFYTQWPVTMRSSWHKSESRKFLVLHLLVVNTKTSFTGTSPAVNTQQSHF